MYIWKCHKDPPCITIINKQKWFLLINEEQEGKTGPVGGSSRRGEGIRKGGRRVNTAEVYSCMKTEW
jgi:hypothetical protein